MRHLHEPFPAPGRATARYSITNPGMIRQFRECCADRAVRGRATAGIPDLRAYRRAQLLTLSQVNRLAPPAVERLGSGRSPPPVAGVRGPLRPGTADLGRRLVAEWDRFRKHVIDLHYDELSTWVHQAAFRARRSSRHRRIHGARSRTATLRVKVTETGEPYDSAGVSVRAAFRETGILGQFSTAGGAHQVKMNGSHSLFANVRANGPRMGRRRVQSHRPPQAHGAPGLRDRLSGDPWK